MLGTDEIIQGLISSIIYSYGLHAHYREGIPERFCQVFFVLRVENIQKRLYKEIQCSLVPHSCYSEGIYIFVLEGKVNFVKPLKFSKKMQANMGIPEIGSKIFF